MLPVRILSIAALLLMMIGCKEDPDDLPEKLATYQLLCPAGLDSCYNECGVSSGVSSGGEPTGEELRAFDTCTSQCDILCDTSFLFLSD